MNDSDALNRGMDADKKNNLNIKPIKLEENILKDISLTIRRTKNVFFCFIINYKLKKGNFSG